MPKKKKIAVIGSGSWGTALANVFADSGNPTVIWGRDTETIRQIEKEHRNEKYLPGIKLSGNIRAETELSKAISKNDIVVCSIPTQQIRAVFGPHQKLLSKKWVLNSSKGIEIETHATVSEIFASLNKSVIYSILSGPSFAQEVIKHLPTAVTVASKNSKVATEIQKIMTTPYFRVYTSADVAGVELAGALKNVIAIASGMVSGLSLGYNAQAALINRGVAEILRMGKKKKAQPLTFMGLAGTGDLILTCTGPLSRNRKLGECLGQGMTFDQAKKTLGGVAEGYYTAHSAYELCKKWKVDAPIIAQIYRILYEGKAPKEAVRDLMTRELKEEW
jgi:glycerol-3-phosphate dehydrogenase (NAD(P)+)